MNPCEANRSDSSPEALFNELVSLRQRVAELEVSEARRQITEDALRESEERYRAVVEAAPEVVYTLSDEGKITSLSRTFESITGWARADWLGKPFAKLVHPDDLALAAGTLQNSLRGKTSNLLELRILTKSGEFLVGEFTSTPYVKNGKVLGVVGIARNITERKRTEDILRIEHDLATALASVSNLKQGLQLCLAAAIKAAHLDCGGFYLMDEKSGALDLLATQGLSPEFIRSVLRYDTESERARLILPGQPVYSRYQDLGLPGMELCEGLRFLALIPLRHEGSVIGCLDVASHTVDDIPRIAREALEMITAQVGHAIVRLKTEDALRKSEELFRKTFEHASAGMCLVSPAGRFLRVNNFLCRMLGYSESELLSHTFNDVTHPDDRGASGEWVRRMLAGVAVSTDLEKRYLHKAGQVVWGTVRSSLLRAPDGAPLYFTTHVQDITARKQMEERTAGLGRLKQQLLGAGSLEQKLKMITDGIVGCMGADFARIWIVRDADLCEKACLHATVKDGPEVCRNRAQCLHLVASSGRYTSLDGGHRRVPLGSYKIGRVASGEVPRFVTNEVATDPLIHDREWAKSLGLVSFAGCRLVNREEKPIGVLAFFSFRPILSLEERLMEDVAATASQIIMAAITEQEQNKLEMQVRQAQKLESLGVLAGGIAHDFNNLLTAILGHADLALADVSPESPVRDSLREIGNASRRAADLCRQMLAYSGKGRFVVETLNLSRLVQEMTHLLGVSISKKAALHCHISESLPAIDADPSQVRQVVMNLVINASEAIGDQEGVITVATGTRLCDEACLGASHWIEPPPPGRYVFLEVADTGCGMDAPTLARVFDPFFTTKFTGRGLGLAAVLGIVRGHKGTVKVTSVPNRGTTFRVLFPAAKNVQTPPVPEEAVQLWRGRGVILLVDDEEPVRFVATKILERCGFQVVCAGDGREAVQLFQDHSPEIACVLLDLTMPRMDGEETYRELRRIRPDVKVIIASGYSEQEISRRFAGQDLTAFIEKPFHMAALNAKLRSVLA